MTTNVQQFDYSVDLMRALLWQFNDAEKLQSLIAAKQAWYDANQSEFWARWYDDVFNVETATEFGLGVWAKILGVTFSVPEGADAANKPIYGFAPFGRNFDGANFTKNASGQVLLTAAQKRLVVKLRYAQLLSRGTVPDINKFCKAVFGEYGNAYVLDPMDMSFAIFTFDFDPDSTVQFVIDKYDLLPRPSTVAAKVRVLKRIPFGFGVRNKNFDHSTFL